jgi:hypothetical protein
MTADRLPKSWSAAGPRDGFACTDSRAPQSSPCIACSACSPSAVRVAQDDASLIPVAREALDPEHAHRALVLLEASARRLPRELFPRHAEPPRWWTCSDGSAGLVRARVRPVRVRCLTSRSTHSGDLHLARTRPRPSSWSPGSALVRIRGDSGPPIFSGGGIPQRIIEGKCVRAHHRFQPERGRVSPTGWSFRLAGASPRQQNASQRLPERSGGEAGGAQTLVQSDDLGM